MINKQTITLTEELMEKFYEADGYLLEQYEKRYPDEYNDYGDMLEIQVVKVNPDTMRMEDDHSLNTKVQVWLEFGWKEYSEESKTYIYTHDIDFDCGADTYEEALIELVRLMKKKDQNEQSKA